MKRQALFALSITLLTSCTPSEGQPFDTITLQQDIDSGENNFLEYGDLNEWTPTMPNETVISPSEAQQIVENAYHNTWSTPTTPAQLNTSAKASGCFGAGSSLVNVICAINSRGGPHGYTDLSMSSVASALCSGRPVMVDVTWGGGHKMLTYHYNGGSTSSLSSYSVIDVWNGTSKSLSTYTATRWRELY